MFCSMLGQILLLSAETKSEIDWGLQCYSVNNLFILYTIYNENNDEFFGVTMAVSYCKNLEHWPNKLNDCDIEMEIRFHIFLI